MIVEAAPDKVETIVKEWVLISVAGKTQAAVPVKAAMIAKAAMPWPIWSFLIFSKVWCNKLFIGFYLGGKIMAAIGLYAKKQYFLEI
jgi:hypothetical protein